MEAWRYRDPALVYERIQEQERRRKAKNEQARQERAKQQLEELFKEPASEYDRKQD